MYKFFVLCVFSQQQIGRGYVYLEYPKTFKSTAVDTQEVLRVKCEYNIFPGNFFCMYEQMVIASGSDKNHVSLRHSSRHFPDEEPCTAVYFMAFSRTRLTTALWLARSMLKD